MKGWGGGGGGDQFEEKLPSKSPALLQLILIHLSQCIFSLPPENIRKPYGFLMLSGGRGRVHWQQMG